MLDYPNSGSGTAERPFSVSGLTGLIKETLEEGFPPLWVRGELTDVKLAGSGHLYFRLKDDGAVISVAMFRPHPQRLDFKPKDGVEVAAYGSLSVYPPRGGYQLICRELLPLGIGVLQRAFEDLKLKLKAEGLFDLERKRKIPRLPKRVGLVTSRDTAALRDLLNVMQRRHGGLDVLLHHAPVQGRTAGAKLAEAVTLLGNSGLVDVLIIGRGGGSYEDLFCFNDEALARAIHACPIPVISAVGHEVDFTIADLVADVRAPTPSAAAELVTAERAELHQRTLRAEGSLIRILSNRIEGERQRLEFALSALTPQRMSNRLNLYRQRLDGLEQRLTHLTQSQLGEERRRLQTAAASLEQLDPRRILGRGYAFISKGERAVESITQLSPADELRVHFHDGVAETIVRRTIGSEEAGTEGAELRGGSGTGRGNRRRAGRGKASPGQTDLSL
jgi:exodeoxyribonuclease VII large subunit